MTISNPTKAKKKREEKREICFLLILTHLKNAQAPPPPLHHHLWHHPLFIDAPLPSPHQTMPILHVVMYQAFRKITNFIRDNGNNWHEFCASTAHTMRKAAKAPIPQEQPSSHKTAKNEGLLAPELLLQENPHQIFLFSIHHANIW
jgi:hypothetical protein